MDLQQREFKKTSGYNLPEHPYTKDILKIYDNIKKSIKTDSLLSDVIDTFQSTCSEVYSSSKKGELNHILEMKAYLAALNSVERFLDEDKRLKLTTIKDLENLVNTKSI